MPDPGCKKIGVSHSDGTGRPIGTRLGLERPVVFLPVRDLVGILSRVCNVTASPLQSNQSNAWRPGSNRDGSLM